MSEYELRMAVADYDEDLARFGEWEFGEQLTAEDAGDASVFWRIGSFRIEREQGSVEIQCDVIDTIAATMRAMDAAVAAFNATFAGPPK